MSATINLDDLKTLIQEIRKPIKTEEELKAQAEKEQSRKDLGETLKQAAINRRAIQDNCSHMRSNGSTSGVYIQNGGYIFCQVCADVIRPNERPEIFNRLFQLTQ